MKGTNERERDRSSRRALVGGALAVGLLASGVAVTAALASGVPAPTAEPKETSSPNSVVSTGAPAWATSMPAPEVVPSISAEEAVSLRSQPWSLISQDGNKLRIVYSVGGSCATAKGFAVAYATTSVTLSALSQIDAAHGGCYALLKVAAATVVLPEPLKGRVLAHAVIDPRSADPEIGN